MDLFKRFLWNLLYHQVFVKWTFIECIIYLISCLVQLLRKLFHKMLQFTLKFKIFESNIYCDTLPPNSNPLSLVYPPPSTPCLPTPTHPQFNLLPPPTLFTLTPLPLLLFCIITNHNGLYCKKNQLYWIILEK